MALLVAVSGAEQLLSYPELPSYVSASQTKMTWFGLGAEIGI